MNESNLNRSSYIRTVAKELRSLPCNALESIRLLLLCSVFTRVWSDQTYLGWSCPLLIASLGRFQNSLRILVVDELFSIMQPLSPQKKLCSPLFTLSLFPQQMFRHSFAPPVETVPLLSYPVDREEFLLGQPLIQNDYFVKHTPERMLPHSVQL